MVTLEAGLVIVAVGAWFGADVPTCTKVATDGTPIDAAAVLLASGLTVSPPSITPRPGGGFVVGFTRPAGAEVLGVDVLVVP